MLQVFGFTLNVHSNINYKWNFQFIYTFLSYCSKNNIQESLTRNQLLIKDITKIIQVGYYTLCNIIVIVIVIF